MPMRPCQHEARFYAHSAMTAGKHSARMPRMSPLLFWLALLLLFAAPVLHVALSPRSGPWLPPQGARCPFGPRLGWLVIVLLLGPLGWLLYIGRRRKS